MALGRKSTPQAAPVEDAPPVPSAAQRHQSIGERLNAARAELAGLTARIGELDTEAHERRVLTDFDTADQAATEADRLRADLPRVQSTVDALTVAELEISRERQRDEWAARLAVAEEQLGELLAQAAQHAAEFAPALSAAKHSMRLALQAEDVARPLAGEVAQLRHELGLAPAPGRYVVGPTPASPVRDRYMRYWLALNNDPEV